MRRFTMMKRDFVSEGGGAKRAMGGNHMVKHALKRGGHSTFAHILCGDRRFSRRAHSFVRALFGGTTIFRKVDNSHEPTTKF